MRSLVLVCGLVLLSVSVVVADSKPVTIPKATMVRAFDAGCSLVVVRGMGVETKVLDRMSFAAYRVQVERVLQAGDIPKSQLSAPIFLFAGPARLPRLQQGRHYVLFIDRDMPTGFDWAFREDVVEVTSDTDRRVEALAKTAKAAYAESPVRKLREGRLPVKPTPLLLTPSLIRTLNEFREKPRSRVVAARAIWESDFGSRLDDSPRARVRSVRVHLRPRTRITYVQAVELLGKPTLKSGFTYYWYCGTDRKPDSAVHHGPETTDYARVPHYGVLTVRFNKTGLSSFVRYTAFDDEDIRDFHSQWK